MTQSNLMVGRPLADQPVTQGLVRFGVPSDTFVSAAGGQLSLTAVQSNGAPLPGWLRFDPQNMQFEGVVPPGVNGVLEILVRARDANGHEATTVFKIVVQDGQRSAIEIPGEKIFARQEARDPAQAAKPRSGLTSQLRLAMIGGAKDIPAVR